MFDSILDLFDRDRRTERRDGVRGMLGRLMDDHDRDHDHDDDRRRSGAARGERDRPYSRVPQDDDDDFDGGGRGPRRSRRDLFDDD
jgi:hypothetical protein